MCFGCAWRTVVTVAATPKASRRPDISSFQMIGRPREFIAYYHLQNFWGGGVFPPRPFWLVRVCFHNWKLASLLSLVSGGVEMVRRILGA